MNNLDKNENKIDTKISFYHRYNKHKKDYA